MSKNKGNNNEKKNKKSMLLIGLSILFVIVIALVSIFWVKNTSKKDENTLAYTDLIKELSYGNIEKVEMTTGSTTVKVKLKDVEEEKTSIVPETESFMNLVQSKVAEGNELELIQKPKSILAQRPSMIIPIAVFVNIPQSPCGRCLILAQIPANTGQRMIQRSPFIESNHAVGISKEPMFQLAHPCPP